MKIFYKTPQAPAIKKLALVLGLCLLVVAAGALTALQYYPRMKTTQTYNAVSTGVSDKGSVITTHEATQQALSTSSPTFSDPGAMQSHVDEDHTVSPQIPAATSIVPSPSPILTPAPTPKPVPCRLMDANSSMRTCTPCPPPCTVSAGHHLCPMAAGATSTDVMCVPICGYAPTNTDTACPD